MKLSAALILSKVLFSVFFVSVHGNVWWARGEECKKRKIKIKPKIIINIEPQNIILYRFIFITAPSLAYRTIILAHFVLFPVNYFWITKQNNSCLTTTCVCTTGEGWINKFKMTICSENENNSQFSLCYIVLIVKLCNLWAYLTICS